MIFIYGSSSSFDIDWWYLQCYHKLLGPKFASLIFVYTSMHKFVRQIVETEPKNFEKDPKSFGDVLTIRHKTNCRRSSLLELLYTYRENKVSLHFEKANFSRKILKTYSKTCIFVWYNILKVVSKRYSSSVEKIFEDCLRWNSFYG